MKKLTLKTIRSYGPCYDPSKYLPDNFKGTILDILNNKSIPFEDRLWVILRKDLVSEKLMRIFAVWSARRVQYLNNDTRVSECLDFMDFYIEYKELIKDSDFQEGLEKSRDAAWAAASAAAGDAARAARDAAGDAARDAAWAAAWAAASAAAGDAARAAASAAARDAAGDAAWAAARDAARAAQESKLREMILEGIKTGDVK